MAQCRICYMPEETKSNALCSPCVCDGSLKYIHKQCLKRWIQTTINPKFTKYCEICRYELILPKRWPLEIVPHLSNTGAWHYLRKSSVSIVLGFTTHYFLLCMYIPQGRRYDLYNGTKSRYLFIYVAFMISFIYAMFYYPLISQLRNKLRYASYWFRIKPPPYMHYNPSAFLITIIANLIFAGNFGVFPFGFAYLALLPRVYVIHTEICRALNDEAEEDF